MNAGVGLVVIGLLEDLVGADAGRLDRGVAVVVQRGGVDVHAADFAVAGLDRIDRPHALGHELGRRSADARRRPGSAACGRVCSRASTCGRNSSCVERAADLRRGWNGGSRNTGSRSCTRCRRRAARRARCGCRRRRASTAGRRRRSARPAPARRPPAARPSPPPSARSLAMLLAITSRKLCPCGPALEQTVEQGLVNEIAGAFAEFDGFGYRGHAVQSSPIWQSPYSSRSA